MEPASQTGNNRDWFKETKNQCPSAAAERQPAPVTVGGPTPLTSMLRGVDVLGVKELHPVTCL